MKIKPMKYIIVQEYKEGKEWIYLDRFSINTYEKAKEILKKNKDCTHIDCIEDEVRYYYIDKQKQPHKKSSINGKE